MGDNFRSCQQIQNYSNLLCDETSTTVYSLHFGSNYANSGARAVYDQIVAMLREHNTIPSFTSGGKNDITKVIMDLCANMIMSQILKQFGVQYLIWTA